jgi:hypothetical protein
MSFTACVRKDTVNNDLDRGSIDLEDARKLSDLLTTDLIHDRRSEIRATTEKAFRDVVDENQLGSMLDQMNESYGKPLEFKFKQAELGARAYDWGTKPMRKFWYAAKTTRYEQGSHFLVVEVVPDGDRLAVSSFAIVSFPLGVPPNLK